jgi:hypothetical protein
VCKAGETRPLSLKIRSGLLPGLFRVHACARVVDVVSAARSAAAKFWLMTLKVEPKLAL